MSVIDHERNLLIRFNRKNSSVHLFAGFANILVFCASDFKAFNNAGLHPLTDIMTSKLKTLDCSLSAAFNFSPQHLICPLIRNGGYVLDANPGRLLMWASANNNGFAAVRA
jgi:hypothetical protein